MEIFVASACLPPATPTPTPTPEPTPTPDCPTEIDADLILVDTDELEKARQVDVNPSSLGYLGYVYAAAGKKAEAQKVLEELKELSKQRYVSPQHRLYIRRTQRQSI